MGTIASVLCRRLGKHPMHRPAAGQQATPLLPRWACCNRELSQHRTSVDYRSAYARLNHYHLVFVSERHSKP
jgi:hypothetical protein